MYARFGFKWLVGMAAAFAACVGFGTSASAQDPYPSRMVKLMVGYGPGTTSDVFARLVAKALSERWHESVVVENRAGAAGAIAAQAVATAPPDGYTLLLMSNAFTLGPLLQKSLPYDPFHDFVAITQLAQTPNIFLATKELGVANLREFMELSRKEPGKLQYSSSGRGTPSQISVELFKSMAGLKIQEIPYRDSNLAFTDVISGTVSLNAPGLAQGLPYVAAGRVVTLGITGSKRSPAAPDIPTLAEAGLPGYEAYGWHGIFAPAHTPPKLVAFLNEAIVSVLNDPKTRPLFVKQGAEVVASTPEQFNAYLKADFDKWHKLFDEVGIKPE
jgi:tripartite-type tricarboxylate transporter receptor subunit TctC